ncbi:MAG: hypothetical protein HY717_08000 [Planctomycetes bacterium]|nr:hypothetical protein [Planctomycetota bacterium]
MIEVSDIHCPQPDRSLRALSGLRQRFRKVFLADGLLALGLAVCMAGAGVFVLDYFLSLPRGVRFVMLLGSAAYLGTLALRRIFQPARRPISLEELAVLVERAHPELKQSLITAVQLTRPEKGSVRYLSSPLIATVVSEVESKLPGIPLDQVVNLKPLYRSALLLFAVSVALLGGAVNHHELTGIWLRRLFLLSAERWPKNVQLELVSPATNPVTIALGEDLPVEVRAVRGQVSQVEVRASSPEGSSRTELLRETPSHTFRRVFESVSQPFKFQVRGGDDELEPVEVLVQIRPKVSHLEVWCQYPAYTGKASTPEDEPILNGHLKVPEGTVVRYRAYTDVPVKEAWFQFLSQEAARKGIGKDRLPDRLPGVGGAAEAWPPPGAQELEVGAVRDLREIRSLAKKPETWQGHEALPKSVFSGRFTVSVSGYYLFHLKGKNDFVNDAPVRYKVQAIGDRKPLVRVLVPVKLHEEVSPEATVRFKVQARDDYGVKSGAIEGVLLGSDQKAGEGGKPVHLPLPELEAADPLEGTKDRTTELVFDLGGLKAAEGSRLQFYAAATDFAGNTGESEPYVLTVVGKEGILNLLRASMMGVKDLIQTASLHQESARQDLDSFYQQAALKEKLGGAEAAKLSRHRQDQQRVTRDIDSAAQEVGRILEKMEANRVGDQKEKDWLRGIQNELEEIAQKRSGEIERQLQELRDQAMAAPQEPARIPPLLDSQRQVERALDALVLRLTEFGDLNAIIQQWRSILKRQTEIRDRVREEIRKESGTR